MGAPDPMDLGQEEGVSSISEIGNSNVQFRCYRLILTPECQKLIQYHIHVKRR